VERPWRQWLKALRCLAIDEISVGREARYLTRALALESGAAVHVFDVFDHLRVVKLMND
jgi:hypothetical protein